jgi:hypothetical protein
MRLEKVKNGHSLPQKLVLKFAHLVLLSEPFDVIRTFMYRPEYFGKRFCDLAHMVMRGPSSWTVGERELFGAFTASLNKCEF